MVAVQPLGHSWTPEAYLAFERAALTKHELIDGRIYAMSGASRRHGLITVNTVAHLHGQLRGRECFLYSADMRVQVVATGTYTYPDVLVVCGEEAFVPDQHNDMLLNPTVIIEVLSPSTEAYDRGLKFERYRALDSLQHYILIAQDRAHIDAYSRHAPIDIAHSIGWLLTEANGLDALLPLPAIGCQLGLAEVYARIGFDEADG